MIEIRNIAKTYRMGTVDVRAVDDVSLKIEAGEFVAIMGASGSGKSTLMHILGLLDAPDKGKFFIAGEDVTALSDDQRASLRNRLIGFVFQQFHLLSRMTALENAGLPLIYGGHRYGADKVRQELTSVGLEQRMTHRPNELSGGQQQRVAIARALVNDPFILMADEPTGNLDTKSKDEIIGILKGLNAQGKTIIMVTHEPEMAAHATRVIRMRDGKIIADDKQGQPPSAAVLAGVSSATREAAAALPSSYDVDKVIDAAKQALQAMITNRMRSFLSILGILIGVAAVIAMLAIGTGAQESIRQQLSSLGSNLLMVRPGSMQEHGVSLQAGTVTRMTLQDVAAVGQLSAVSHVSPSVTGRVQVVYGGKNTNTQVEGAGVDYAVIRAAVPVTGRFFTDEESRGRAKVAVVGTTVVAALFGGTDPVGETIRVNAINFTVIGVLPTKGATGFRDQDDTILVPATTAMYRLLGKQYVDSIYVEAASEKDLDALQTGVLDLLCKRHHASSCAGDSAPFQIRNMADIKNAMESTTQTMTLLLGAIAAISLLVGGIGIMNIMLVSVTERTREIGLRKAIGATRRDIMMQFLVESVLMAVIGGILGVLLGAGVSALISFFAGWAARVSMMSVILSTTFSLLVGVAFGLWPAQKAARLDPITALRYE